MYQLSRNICKARTHVPANFASRFTHQRRHVSINVTNPRSRSWGLLFSSLGIIVTTGYALSIPVVSDSNKSSFGSPDPQDILDFELASRYFGTVVSNSVSGLRRFDMLSVASNVPGEDRFSEAHFELSPTLSLATFSVYDGHSGSRLADRLSKILTPAVMLSIADVYSKYAELEVPGHRNPGEPPNPHPPSEEIDAAITKAFKDVDDLVVHGGAMKALGLEELAYKTLQKDNNDAQATTSTARKRHAALREVSLANEGSCALMSIYNTEERLLRLALTGDSRAVFGRRVPDSSTSGFIYEAEELTMDQNATNPEEATRLRAEHPNEPDLLKNNRVVGWGPSRAFGDGSMKWSRAVQSRLNQEALCDRPRETCKTPPYFTAEPVITVKESIQKGDFVVLASDGLWDCLTSEEVVGLVGMWLEKNGSRASSSDGTRQVSVPPLNNYSRKDLAHDEVKKAVKRYYDSIEGHTKATDLEQTWKPSELPVRFPDGYEDKTGMYKYWRTEKKFVCEDQDTNVAAHLTRNALGGADADLRGALMQMRPPRSRRFRDDISIVVLFFD